VNDVGEVRASRCGLSPAEANGARGKWGKFSVLTGEVCASSVVESGSGKSVTLRALMRLLPPRSPGSRQRQRDGQDVMACLRVPARFARRPGAMVFQETMTALDRSTQWASRSARDGAPHNGC